MRTPRPETEYIKMGEHVQLEGSGLSEQPKHRGDSHHEYHLTKARERVARLRGVAVRYLGPCKDCGEIEDLNVYSERRRAPLGLQALQGVFDDQLLQIDSAQYGYVCLCAVCAKKRGYAAENRYSWGRQRGREELRPRQRLRRGARMGHLEYTRLREGESIPPGW